MKKLNFYIFIIVVNTIAFTTVAQDETKKESTLEITTAAFLNNQRVSNYSISVYLDGTRIDSIYTKNKESVKLTLVFNKVFTFLFQKNDCHDKILIVNTQIPTDIKKMQDTTFDFLIELSQSFGENSNYKEDYQVAVVMINEKDELLEASKSYNKLTHNESEIIIGISDNSLLPLKNK